MVNYQVQPNDPKTGMPDMNQAPVKQLLNVNVSWEIVLWDNKENERVMSAVGTRMRLLADFDQGKMIESLYETVKNVFHGEREFLIIVGSYIIKYQPVKMETSFDTL